MDQEVQRNSDTAEASRAKRRLSSGELYGGEAQHQDTGLEIRTKASARHGHTKNRLNAFSPAPPLPRGREGAKNRQAVLFKNTATHVFKRTAMGHGT